MAGQLDLLKDGVIAHDSLRSRHGRRGADEGPRRTSALDVDVGLVELVNELGELLEVTVHCVEACKGQLCACAWRKGGNEGRRTLEVAADEELASHGC